MDQDTYEKYTEQGLDKTQQVFYGPFLDADNIMGNGKACTRSYCSSKEKSIYKKINSSKSQDMFRSSITMESYLPKNYYSKISLKSKGKNDSYCEIKPSENVFNSKTSFTDLEPIHNSRIRFADQENFEDSNLQYEPIKLKKNNSTSDE